MSREYSEEELRDLFLNRIHDLISYWENEDRAKTTHAKMEGLAFSILTMLDGESANIPSMQLILFNDEEDIEYLKKQEKNYAPLDGVDITGCLHEQFYKKGSV